MNPPHTGTPPAIDYGGGSLFHLDSRRFVRTALPPAQAAADPEIAAGLAELGAVHPTLAPLFLDGHGRIAAILTAAGARPLPDPTTLPTSTPVLPAASAAGVLVSVSDGPPPAHWQHLDAHCRRHGIAWHRIWVEGQVTYCGPFLMTPTDPGFRDTELRRRAAEPQPDARNHALDQQRRQPHPADPLNALAACARVLHDLATPESRQQARTVLVAFDPGAQCREHRVLPWPGGIQEQPIP